MKILTTTLAFRSFLLLFGLLLFSQCTDEKYGFASEIEAHFGEMNYLSVTFPEKVKFGKDEKLVTARGRVQDSLKRAPEVSWFMIANSKGEIGGIYIGSKNTASTGTVEMSAGDYASGSEKCWRASDGTAETQGALDKCLNDLNLLLIIECVLASDGASGFSCPVDCWFNGGACF